MGKNIIIGLLVVVSLGCIVFAFYQRTLAENALVEALEWRQRAEEAIEQSERMRESAETSERLAHEMAQRALIEAEQQRKIAEAALAK
ncbi:hypothetical protein [Fulvivirga sp.]|uniref:hypothetical protein n=1 Tax=Fulvivirga sp. TaxID=1931237 RepID=UPI0032EE66E0